MTAEPSELVIHLCELFERFGAVEARRMFGGYGLFHDELMFGLVASDRLYLKADATSAPDFVERGLAQFEYTKQGRATRLSYYLAPDEVFDDPEAAEWWAAHAFDAALRSRK
jgi:DNA transformation protein